MEKQCKEMVWDRFHEHPCLNRAKYGDYCGTHCPERKKAREKARGPSKWDLERIKLKKKREHLEFLEEAHVKMFAALESVWDGWFLSNTVVNNVIEAVAFVRKHEDS